MKVNGKHFRTIWLNDRKTISVIDQRKLPFRFEIMDLSSVEQVAQAIRQMVVRGAGLIGATAGYGMYLATIEEAQVGRPILDSAKQLKDTRPTAVNLSYAVDRVLGAIAGKKREERIEAALREAEMIADEDAAACQMIGRQGLGIIRELAKKVGRVNILTHCNAGWLAFIDYGSATAPIYEAFEAGIDVHVWVDETRPRNQGARLTAWELGAQGVPHTVIPDNTGGHLMQKGMVDLVIVGSDRTTRTGDVANKIGTYLKALAAFDNQIPFYVALPSSSFDWEINNGKDVPIEQRDGKEVAQIFGWDGKQEIAVKLVPPGSQVTNFGFDITPARLVTGLITERGICAANEESIKALFPDKIL